MRADIVLGLGFGDEGKGATVDYLCSRAVGPVVVIRFNGGAQCAHNVVLPDGTHHTFSQYGSGTLRGAATHITKDVLVNPILLDREMEVLRWSAPITVDRDALVTDAYHIAINRWKVRGTNASCGLGINETVCAFESAPEAALRVGDLDQPALVWAKLEASRKRAAGLGVGEGILFPRLCETYEALGRKWGSRFVKEGQFYELYANHHWVFEGAQGALLDQRYGFYPHVTRSNTTADNALRLIRGEREFRKIGVIRSYMTRHGAGPMPTEGTEAFLEAHNRCNEFQGPWRCGALDGPLIKYAMRMVQGVDSLAVNHLDVLREPMPLCTRYKNNKLPETREEVTGIERQKELWQDLTDTVVEDYERVSPAGWISALEGFFGVSVGIMGAGPTARDRYGD